MIECLRNPDIEEDPLDLAFALLVDLCQNEKDPGAILIFVPGIAQISHMNKLIKTSGKFPPHSFLVIPLHSMLATVDQRQVNTTATNFQKTYVQYM